MKPNNCGADTDIIVGNALVDGQMNQGTGWFMGYFISPQGGGVYSKDVELKWGIHSAGEEKRGTGINNTCRTLSLLIKGRFTLIFPTRENVTLENEGDYVVFDADVPHCWRAEMDSTVLSVRWPSLPDDQSVDMNSD